MRPLTDNDIPTITDFLFKTYENKFGALQALVKVLEMPNSLAWVREDTRGNIIGYSVGYALSKDVFYFADIYVSKAVYLQKFINELEEDIATKGFSTWLSTAVTKEGKTLLNKIAERI